MDFRNLSRNSHLPLPDGQVTDAKSSTTNLHKRVDYRGHRKYGRIHFGTRHHFVPHKMVEITGDTDGTVEFECAILNANRPGAVKCSTQCANCKVVYEQEPNRRVLVNDNDNGSDDDSSQESTVPRTDSPLFTVDRWYFEWRVPDDTNSKSTRNWKGLRMRITPSEIFCGTFVAIFTVLSYWTSIRQSRKENQPS